MSKIYCKRSIANPFKFYKTTDDSLLDEIERIRDHKNNYPIICPRPPKGEIRIDATGVNGYFYKLKGIKGEINAIIYVSHKGIIKIEEFNNGIFLESTNYAIPSIFGILPKVKQKKTDWWK